MLKPTMKVEEALSGEPQINSLKTDSSYKDPPYQGKLVPSARGSGVRGRSAAVRGRSAAGFQARQLRAEPSKAPETPLSATSMPVPPQVTPKSDTGTTPSSSNQSVPSAKRKHRSTSSTPLTGAGQISGVEGGFGGDSSELSLIQLKERLTNDLMQNITNADELGRRAVFWEKKQAESEAKIKKVQADLKKAEEALAISASQMKEVSAKHKKEMAFKDQKLAALTKEKEQQFNLGKKQGRADFLQSEEFQLMLKKARQDRFLDFEKSPEFTNLGKAVDHVMTAFNNCRAQLFDVSKPDTIKTESSGKDEYDLPPPGF